MNRGKPSTIRKSKNKKNNKTKLLIKIKSICKIQKKQKTGVNLYFLRNLNKKIGIHILTNFIILINRKIVQLIKLKLIKIKNLMKIKAK